MHFEILLEEPSAEVVITTIVPKIVGTEATLKTHVFQGKQDLLKKLPERLRAYRSYMQEDWVIVVLIDRDNDSCHTLKTRLNNIAADAGLVTRSQAAFPAKYQVLNRIAVEEIEAWYFGDVPALQTAFPKIPRSIGQQATYRDPDGIAGGTSEALERLLKRHDYYRSGLAKKDAAKRIADHLNVDRNASRSFTVFREALDDIMERWSVAEVPP